MKDFDIYQELYPFWEEPDEELIQAYKSTLMERFIRSSQWQELQPADEIPLWVDLFLDYVLFYESVMLPYFRSEDLRDFLYNFLPAKTLVEPEKAAEIIRELKAFWEFIDQTFEVHSSKPALKILNQKNIISRVEKELSDPNKFSPIKSIMKEATDSGVDITDQKQMEAFIEAYNKKLRLQAETPQDKTLSEEIQQKRDAIVAILEPICRKHLNDEYSELAVELTDALAYLPSPPILQSREKSWAAGIVYALAQVNFLFDPSQTPHLKAGELCTILGVSQQTASGKAKEISDIFELMPFHPEWTLPSRMGENPLVWMVMDQNGMMVDLRRAPREVQEEAFKRGLIPYIPADQN